MKIAIATDDQTTIARHFGRTKGFEIFTVENDQIITQEYRENDFTGHARGLHGDHHADHHSSILTALKDCKVVISRGMGRRIIQDLNGADIEAIITDKNSILDAMDAYLAGQLQHHPESTCHH